MACVGLLRASNDAACFESRMTTEALQAHMIQLLLTSLYSRRNPHATIVYMLSKIERFFLRKSIISVHGTRTTDVGTRMTTRRRGVLDQLEPESMP